MWRACFHLPLGISRFWCRLHPIIYIVRFSFGSGDWRQASDTWKQLRIPLFTGLKKRFQMRFQNTIPTPPRIIWPYCVPSSSWTSGSCWAFPRSCWPLVFVFDQHGYRGGSRQEGLTLTPGLSPMCWVPNIPQRLILAAGGFRGGVWVMSQRCCVIKVLCSK